MKHWTSRCRLLEDCVSAKLDILLKGVGCSRLTSWPFTKCSSSSSGTEADVENGDDPEDLMVSFGRDAASYF